MKKSILFIIFYGLISLVSAQNLKDVDQRVKNLISQLTFSQKIQQMLNNAPAVYTTNPSIKAYSWWNEGLHGIMGTATVFPQAIGLSATWDVQLMNQVATAISDEGRARKLALTFWSPNINIFRDPRWGRGQETYGEDPYLTSRMGVTFIKAFQGNDPHYLKLVSTPKHFAVHSGPEPLRHVFNAIPTQTDLWETYLPAFKACVVEGKAYSVMGAYSSLFGVPACASKLLLDSILRKKWHFKGYVVSDCEAITDIWSSHHYTTTAEQAAVAAIKAGCDLECGSTAGFINITSSTISNGLIKEAEIDTALFRLLKARFLLGEFDPADSVPYSKISSSVISSPAHRAIALKAAQESVVLLKNNGLLPLNKTLGSIAVIGPNANNDRVLWGNYNGTPKTNVTVLQGIKNRTNSSTIINYFEGCPIVTGANILTINAKYFKTPTGAAGLKAEFFNNKTLTGMPVLTRIDPNINFNWGAGSPGTGVNTDNFSARWTGKLTPDASGYYNISVSGDDGFRLFINGNKIIDDWGDHGTETRSIVLNMIKDSAYDIKLEFYDNLLNANVNIQWVMNYSYGSNNEIIDSLNLLTLNGEKGLKGEYFNNINLIGAPVLTRIDKSINFNWGAGSPDPLIKTDSFSVRWTGRLKIDTTGMYTLSASGDDGYRFFLNNKQILADWTIHPLSTQSASILLYKDSIYNIQFEYFENLADASIRLEWGMIKYDENHFNQIVDSAKNNDVIIFVGGISPILESESGQTIAAEGFNGGDRTDIELPREQKHLLEALKKTGKPIVLVLMSGSCLALNWANDSIPAILQTWYAGQEGGNAIADVLFGNYNPAGRLPMTYYKSIDDLPDFTDYSMSNRTYRYFKGKALFPFGFGLSYSSFNYSNLILPTEPIDVCYQDTVNVIYTLQNTGNFDGDEVVQLYIKNNAAPSLRPIKELKAFKRIHLLSKQIITDTIKLNLLELYYYDTIHNEYKIAPGNYDIQLGASSQDIRQNGNITLENCGLGMEEIKSPNMRIFPNPTNDKTIVEIGYNTEKAEITVFDVMGRLLNIPVTEEIKGARYVVDFSDSNKGIYFIRVTTTMGKTKTVKVCVSY